MGKLEEKVALVFGATSGIGKATAELFAKEGAQVFFCGRRSERGKVMEEAMLKQGSKASFYVCDGTVEEQVEDLVKKVMDKAGRLDILVNNAGVSLPGTLMEMDLEKNFDVTMDVNVKSFLRILKQVIPVMTAQGQGVIVNTSSVGGITPMPSHLAYTISKAAILRLTKSLAVQYAPNGIRVNAIVPGLTDTEINEGNEAFIKEIVKSIPLGRIATSEEIAKGILFLASEDSSFMTGAELVMDGGESL